MVLSTLNTTDLSPEAKMCVERVLRTTATTINFTKDEASIKEQVKAELEKVIGSDGGLVGALKDKEAAAAVLSVAFIGLSKLVDVVEQGIQTVKVKRSNLRDQMELNLPVFIVPDEEILSDEQAFVRGLMGLVKETKLDGFEEWLGIRSVPPKKRGDLTSYYVIPFHDVETGLIEEDSHTERLDNKRKEIYAHIRLTLEGLRETISQDFKKGNWLTHWFWSSSDGDNYLNNYNQALFTLAIVANLLWKLLHPVNAKTGKRLTPGECVALCGKLDLFLSYILIPNWKPYLKQNRKTEWADFIHISQILVQDLQNAYAVEQLREFPIKPLAIHARDTAKMTAKVLFELLYQHHDEFSEKYISEPKTAEHLEAILKNLLNFLKKNPAFLDPFRCRAGQLPVDPGLHKVLNQAPETLLDILIVFSHLKRFERVRLREELKALDKEDGGFVRCLEAFDDKYIRTLNKVLKTDPKAGFEGASGREERAHLIGRRLIPCLALLIDAFEMPVDTQESYALAKSSEENVSNGPVQKTGKQQVKLINDLNRVYLRKKGVIDRARGLTDLENPLPYFYGVASSLVNRKKNFVATIDQLLPSIQKMADIAAFVKGLKVVISKYGSVLQNQEFLDVLKVCIDEVNLAQTEFKMLIDRTQRKLATNGNMSNELKCRLAPITDALQESLTDFTIAALAVRRVISDPEFAEFQQASFQNKIELIDAKYADAFDKQSGFSKIFLKTTCGGGKSSYAKINPLLGLSPDSPRKPLSAELLAIEETDRFSPLEISSEASGQVDSVMKRKKIFRYKHHYRSGLKRAKELYASMGHSPPSDNGAFLEKDSHVKGLRIDIDATGTNGSDVKVKEQQQIILFKEAKEKELQRFSLIGFIDVCHDSMSYWSQWGHKGTLLKDLKKRVGQDEALAPAALRDYILDLVRVASSYRRTWFGFFQADYAASKSAKALIRAIRDKKVNLVLPIVEIIFGDRDIDLSKLSDADIMKELIRQRAASDWEFAEDEILEKNFSCCAL